MSLRLGRKKSPPEPRGKDYVVECKGGQRFDHTPVWEFV